MSKSSFLRFVGVALFLATAGASRTGAQAMPPDAIRTQDGALYRGVIIESVPGDHVLLLLPNGELRRLEAAEIVSTEVVAPSEASVPAEETTSGASNAPTSTSNVVVGRGSLRVSVVAQSPGLTLHGNAMGRMSERICYERCELRVDPGNYHFEVEDARARFRPSRETLLLDRDGELRVRVESRRRGRTVLALVGLGLALGSLPLWLLDSRLEYSDWDTMRIKPAYVTAGSLMLATGVVMVGYTFAVRDRGAVEFAPY